MDFEERDEKECDADPFSGGFLQLLTPDGTGAIVQAGDSSGIGIEYVSFSDGTRLTVSQFLARLDDSQTVTGSTRDDTLVLGGGNDVIDGGQGNDLLVGAAGNDTYRFGRGSGQDVIDQTDATASDVDVVRMKTRRWWDGARGLRAANNNEWRRTA